MYRFIMLSFFWSSLLLAELPSPKESSQAISSYLYSMRGGIHTIFVKISRKEWESAQRNLLELIEGSKDIKKRGVLSESFISYVDDGIRHSEILQNVMTRKDLFESFVELRSLERNLQRMKASQVEWLWSDVLSSLNDIEQGITIKNKLLVSEGVLQIHNMTNVLILSAALAPNEYRHLQWVSSIDRIQEIYMEMQPLIRGEEWLKINEKKERLRYIISKWLSAIKEISPAGDK